MSSKNDGFGGSSTKYDAWGEMTAKYAGRRRGATKDVAPAAQLTSMGPPSREVETATGSTGEAEKNGSELENVSHFKFDRPAVEVAAAGAISRRRGSAIRQQMAGSRGRHQLIHGQPKNCRESILTF